MNHVVRMCDLSFDPKLFESFRCGTALDELLSSHRGLPRGVNYMIIGDPVWVRLPSYWICWQIFKTIILRHVYFLLALR